VSKKDSLHGQQENKAKTKRNPHCCLRNVPVTERDILSFAAHSAVESNFFIIGSKAKQTCGKQKLTKQISELSGFTVA